MIIILLFSILYIGITLSATCNYDGCVHVKNECPFTLYLQRDDIDGSNINRPDRVTTLYSSSETVLDVSAWKSMVAGKRLSAWWQNPVGKNLDPMTYREKVEINYGCTGKTRMCYNPTAVDYYGLPVRVGPYNIADCPSGVSGQYTINVNDIKNQCPSQYIATPPAGVCRSPYHICISNPSHSICDDLDAGISKCKSNGECSQSITRTNVFGCNGELAQKPALCAALHRGVYGTNNGNNPDAFYQTGTPYNKYSKWIHSNDIKVYGFPYDDDAQQGGYKECDTNFLSVTFCASSASSDFAAESDSIMERMEMMEMMQSDSINPSTTPSPVEVEPIESIYSHDTMMRNYEMMEMMQSDSINPSSTTPTPVEVEAIYSHHENEMNSMIRNYEMMEMMEMNKNIDNNNIYDEIVSADGRCLDVNDKLYNYLSMQECNGKSQQAFSYNNGIIKTEVDNYCLTVDIEDYDSKENDVLVVMRICNEQKTQKWNYESSQIILSNGKCLHVKDGDASGSDPYKLRLRDCDGSDNQHWIMGVNDK